MQHKKNLLLSRQTEALRVDGIDAATLMGALHGSGKIKGEAPFGESLQANVRLSSSDLTMEPSVSEETTVGERRMAEVCFPSDIFRTLAHSRSEGAGAGDVLCRFWSRCFVRSRQIWRFSQAASPTSLCDCKCSIVRLLGQMD